MDVCLLPRHDPVLRDEEGCLSSDGVMIRGVGMKKRQIVEGEWKGGVRAALRLKGPVTESVARGCM